MERVGMGISMGLQPTEIVECVQLAEELGYESAWMPEGHAGDQFSILTACAMATDRIMLGTAISSVYVRTAPTIAMAAACVDYYSGGRFILGLGTSHKVQVEPEHGQVFTNPIGRLIESIEVVRSLLRDGEVTHKGDVIDIERFDLWFKPLRKEIPIYLAGVFPKMLKICGQIAKGAILAWSTPSRARLAADSVAEGARSAGRDPNEVEVLALVGCSVSEDREEARNRMRRPVASYVAQFPRYRKAMASAGYGDELEAVRQAWQEGDQEKATGLVPAELIDEVCAVGTPEDCRHHLDRYREAGVGVPIITARVSGPNAKHEAMEAIRACAPR